MLAVVRVVLALAVLLTGCTSLSDVKQGDGKRATITGYTYDQVWAASIKVADEHFHILEQDKSAGIIKAEREQHFMEGAGHWVGIYVTPPRDGAEAYTVEVSSRKKLVTQVSGQGWESKVLRDVQDVLAGRPMR